MKINVNKLISTLLVICVMITVFVQAGCGNNNAHETTKVPATEAPATEAPATDAPETTAPDPSIVYNISYELDGGVNANENPHTYTAGSGDITLFVPIRNGFAFAGWIGTGLDAATEKVVIESGSYGDRTYTATWKEAKNVCKEESKEDPLTDEEKAELQNSNDGIAANPNGTPLSKPDDFSVRGDGLFFMKTAYTTIEVDGVMDAAYTYGLHFELDLPQFKEE